MVQLQDDTVIKSMASLEDTGDELFYKTYTNLTNLTDEYLEEIESE